MKTVIILHHGGNQIRGTEVCLIQTIEVLSKNGFRIIVLRKDNCLDKFIAEHVDCILNESFPEIMFDGNHKTFPIIKYIRSSFRLFQIVKKSPCMILCSGGLPCQLSIPIAKLLNVPLLCHFHHPAPKRYFYIWMVKFATKLIFPSNYTRSVVIEKCGRGGEVIYNAVDVRHRFVPVNHRKNSYRQDLGIDDSAIVIGQVGNLAVHKRPDILIRCFAEARKQIKNLFLILVGAGPLHQELKSLIDDLGLEQSVMLLGYVPDVQPYYQHVIDINVLASSEEGLGISVIEASACALPSIVTNCTGLREVVDENITGLFFDRDDTARLTECIILLANNPKLRRKLALAAREKAEEFFSLERYKNQMLQQIKHFY